MTLKTKFGVDSEGTTVPYGAFSDSIRKNYGFQDLRGKPEAAGSVAETAGSDALRRLLVRIAQPGFPIFTLGCDLGAHEEPEAPPARRRVSGGYVQVAAVDYDKTTGKIYSAFANGIARVVREAASKRWWELRFVLKGAAFKFDPLSGDVHPTVWIWFFASASNLSDATLSREGLVDAIGNALSSPAVLAKLKG
jgi:hypothetical protein